jgi:hypothetical protein
VARSGMLHGVLWWYLAQALQPLVLSAHDIDSMLQQPHFSH